jgi:hypothetical protein
MKAAMMAFAKAESLATRLVGMKAVTTVVAKAESSAARSGTWDCWWAVEWVSLMVGS